MLGKTVKKSKGYVAMLAGLMTSAILLLLLLGVIAILMRQGSLSEKGIHIVLLISVFLSSMGGCFSSVNRSSARRLPSALVPAAAIALSLIAGRLISGKPDGDRAFTWLMLMTAVLPGLILGIKKQRAKRRDYRR